MELEDAWQSPGQNHRDCKRPEDELCNHCRCNQLGLEDPPAWGDCEVFKIEVKINMADIF